jgi:hypothetical protein
MDGLCDWLEAIMTEAGVSEGLLKGKVDRISAAIQTLYVDFISGPQNRLITQFLFKYFP